MDLVHLRTARRVQGIFSSIGEPWENFKPVLAYDKVANVPENADRGIGRRNGGH